MKFLIIDTSGPDSFVCLWDHETSATCKTKLLPPLKQSQTLLPAIQELLEGQTIDFITIGTGPGSFTGTRVGVMTAKTLAFALKIPLIPFCSLKIHTPNEEGSFVLFSDAKSSGTFALEGVRTSETTSFQKPYIKEGKEPLSKGLNLPFLGKYLLGKFLESDGDFSPEVQVCYLKTP
ncbi:MAG: tRNA (adenosine(37)-N6)-threonylcarbamoyltransferase complex dimerization subunit type 1 TsaB [Candidatus Neptunochlamydia sp.]|nr:tRNA (adenosine(37)-N6)-threonylcarbamoyltransferase complex dimerization subunit type 1 TsaB [Candidatus Neptunochlamydia sp.]